MNAVKLLPMSTDPRGGWALRGDGVRPAPPSEPGESVRLEAEFGGPKAFTSLRVGPDPRYSTLGSGGALVGAPTPGTWRVDEVTIDGAAIDHVVAALAAEALVCADQRVLIVHGAFGVGSRVAIRAANIGDTAAYFYATWELEDVDADRAAAETKGETLTSPLQRLFTPEQSHPYDGMIICRDHLRQVLPGDGPPFILEEIAVDQAAFWNHRCLMCGVDAVPGRLCENEDCRRPLHPQWPAVYCCNDCALEDA